MHFSQTFSFKRTERACEEGSGGVRGARGGAGQDQRLAQHQQVSHLGGWVRHLHHLHQQVGHLHHNCHRGKDKGWGGAWVRFYMSWMGCFLWVMWVCNENIPHVISFIQLGSSCMWGQNAEICDPPTNPRTQRFQQCSPRVTLSWLSMVT